MVRLKNITITATTPANSGVRFETGLSELYISNRVQNMQSSCSSGRGENKLNRFLKQVTYTQYELYGTPLILSIQGRKGTVPYCILETFLMYRY